MCGLCSCLIQENKDPEAVRRRAMQNPEIQQIIADPAMQLILQQMQKDPQALREYVCLSDTNSYQLRHGLAAALGLNPPLYAIQVQPYKFVFCILIYFSRIVLVMLFITLCSLFV